MQKYEIMAKTLAAILHFPPYSNVSHFSFGILPKEVQG